MTITDQTPATATALASIESAIADLKRLAEFVQARPDVAPAVTSMLDKDDAVSPRPRALVCVGNRLGVGNAPEYIAGLAGDAAEYGAQLEVNQGPKYAGVNADFGFLQVYIYAALELLGTTVQQPVSVWQMDPAIAALGTGAGR